MPGLAMLGFSSRIHVKSRGRLALACVPHLDQLQNALVVGALLVWHLEPRAQQGEVELCRQGCGDGVARGMERGKTAGECSTQGVHGAPLATAERAVIGSYSKKAWTATG